MPDLSSLSDEQLAVYREMVAARSQPSAPKAKTLDQRQGTSARGYKSPSDDSYSGKFMEGAAKGTLMPVGPPLSSAEEAWQRLKGIPRGILDTAKGALTGDPETLGQLAAGLPYALGGGAKPIAAVERGGRAIPSGVRGAIREAKTPAPLPAVRIPGVGRVAIEDVTVPTIVSDAARGAGFGGGVGAVVPGVTSAGGAAAGAAVGAGKTVVRGYRKGTAEFRKAQQQAAKGPRAPITAPPSNVPGATPTATTAPPPSAPGALPSGRKPGGIHNQQNQPAPVPAEAAAAVADPLDTVAADLGYKKPYSKLTASQQMEVKIAVKAAEQAAEKAATPLAEIVTEAKPDTSPFGQAMDAALKRLKETNQIPQDFKRGTLGGPNEGPAVFDTGSGGPVIDSSKSRFNKPVANPRLLKQGQPEQVIKGLEGKGSLTDNQKALLEQMREEMKRRSK